MLIDREPSDVQPAVGYVQSDKSDHFSFPDSHETVLMLNICGDRSGSGGFVKPFGEMLYDSENPVMVFRFERFDLDRIRFQAHRVEAKSDR